MKKQVDFLNGSIWDKMIWFALPLAATSALQQIFNVADVAVAGRFAGSAALAAVGANSQIINLLVNLFVGLSVGANAVIATYLGQQRKDLARRAVHTAILVSVLSGCLLLVIGQIFARLVLEGMGTPADIIDGAESYFRIYFMGMPFIMLYNFESAIMRSQGNTARPLVVLALSGMLNIFLNLFLVIVCHLGVRGVALATVISNVLSSLILLRDLTRQTEELQVRFSELRLDKMVLVKIAQIGIPAGLQGVVFSISNVCIQSAVNALGSLTVAGSTAALNVEVFTYYCINAMNQTEVTFIGQNYGAGKYQRCRQVVRWGMILGAISVVVVSAVLLVLRRPCMQIFTSDPAVVEIACKRVLLILPFELLNMAIEIFSGALRGMGKSGIPAIVCVGGICGVRIVYLYTIYPGIASFEHLMMAYPISWVITASILAVIYLRVARRELAY